MSRLTKRHGKHAVQIGGETRRNDIGWLRLAHYEDLEEQGLLTILNNETFKRDELDRCTHRSCNNCDKYRRELQRYKDLEEQGRLIELPCEKWSSLYHVCWINKKYVVEPLTVVGFSGNDKDDLVIKVFRIYHNLAEMEFSVGAIGVSIFTTEEEAEAKLKEVENG